jgi:hypothetical protein
MGLGLERVAQRLELLRGIARPMCDRLRQEPVR